MKSKASEYLELGMWVKSEEWEEQIKNDQWQILLVGLSLVIIH